MFKTEQVEKEMIKLNQQKGLMLKFRAKMVAATTPKPKPEDQEDEEEELDQDA